MSDSVSWAFFSVPCAVWLWQRLWQKEELGWESGLLPWWTCTWSLGDWSVTVWCPREGCAGAAPRDREEAWSALAPVVTMLCSKANRNWHSTEDAGMTGAPAQTQEGKKASSLRTLHGIFGFWSLSWEHMTSLLSIREQQKIEEKTFMFTCPSKNIFWRRQFKKSCR